MWDRLESIERRYEELTAEMARPETVEDYEHLQALNKERSALEEVVNLYRRYRSVESELEEARTLASDRSDRDLQAMARDEVEQLEKQSEAIGEAIERALLPKDSRDDKNVILDSGEPAELPENILKALADRRREAISKAPWAERHHRPGTRL